MKTKIELGELAFTAEEFKALGWTDFHIEIAKDANRILAEKLGRAPELFGVTWSKQWYEDKLPVMVPQDQLVTARLVCIEEIPKC